MEFGFLEFWWRSWDGFGNGDLVNIAGDESMIKLNIFILLDEF